MIKCKMIGRHSQNCDQAMLSTSEAQIPDIFAPFDGVSELSSLFHTSGGHSHTNLPGSEFRCALGLLPISLQTFCHHQKQTLPHCLLSRMLHSVLQLYIQRIGITLFLGIYIRKEINNTESKLDISQHLICAAQLRRLSPAVWNEHQIQDTYLILILTPTL